MKALLMKYLLNLKGQLKSICLSMVMFSFIIIFTQNINMLSFIFLFFASSISMSWFTIDEKSRWEKYGLTLPVSRGNVVIARYLMGLLIMAIGTAFSLAFVFCLGKDSLYDNIGMTFAFVEGALLYLSIVFPLLFKFGVKKSRVMIMTIVMSSFILIFVLGFVNKSKWFDGIQIPVPSEPMLVSMIMVAPVVMLVVFLLSALLSIQIYKKRQF